MRLVRSRGRRPDPRSRWQLLLFAALAAGPVPAGAGAVPTLAAEVASPALPPADTTIALRLVRLRGGSGPVLLSSGVPLAPGLLKADQTKYVSLRIRGEEQPIFVEALAGRHRDGTLRSILVQLRYLPPSALTTPAELVIGPPRSAPDLARTPTRYSISSPVPDAVALPASSRYLISTGIVGGTVPSAEGFNPQYERTFVQQSDMRWAWLVQNYPQLTLDEAASLNYYDRSLAHYAWWVRTGDPEYWKRATYYEIAYRETYVLSHYTPTSGGWTPQPHNSQLEGMAVHYLLTGDERSRLGVGEIARFYSQGFTPTLLGDPRAEWQDTRIQARVLLAHLNAWKLDAPGTDWAGLLRRDLSAILGTQNPDGSYTPRALCGGVQFNYMAGLLNDALTKYYTDFEADPRIPGAVQRSVDYLWGTQWIEAAGGFRYASGDCKGDGPVAAPDLNLLIVNGFGFTYARTGDVRYRQRGDHVFHEGVVRAWIGNAPGQAEKQFNENYGSSFRYEYFRSAARPG